MCELHELETELAKMNRWPAEYEAITNLNCRVITETDTSVMYDKAGPSMHSSLLRAVITPKDDRYPELAVVRLAPHYHFGFMTTDGSDLPFQSLIGRFSKPDIAHKFYDAAIKREVENDHD